MHESTCPHCGRPTSGAAACACGRATAPAPYAPPPLAPLDGAFEDAPRVRPHVGSRAVYAPPPCPTCGSHALAPLPLVRAEDPAGRPDLAPPIPRAGRTIPQGAYVVAALLWILPFVAGPGAMLIPPLGSLILILCLYVFRDADTAEWNRDVLPPLAAAWERSLVCRGCGRVLDPGAPPASLPPGAGPPSSEAVARRTEP